MVQSRASIWLPHIIYALKRIIMSERGVAPTGNRGMLALFRGFVIEQ
jgi:hypothetical protein